MVASAPAPQTATPPHLNMALNMDTVLDHLDTHIIQFSWEKSSNLIQNFMAPSVTSLNLDLYPCCSLFCASSWSQQHHCRDEYNTNIFRVLRVIREKSSNHATHLTGSLQSDSVDNIGCNPSSYGCLSIRLALANTTSTKTRETNPEYLYSKVGYGYFVARQHRMIIYRG